MNVMLSLRTMGQCIRRRVADDLRADPYLLYILVLAAILTGFWFWHRLPNFATWDEWRRILGPMAAGGNFATDPGVESLRQSIGSGPAFGATFYLFGIALVPVAILVLLTGQLDAFGAYSGQSSAVGMWLAPPEWFWTVSLATVRLLNVLLAVGSVYITYRIGTAMRDRPTGRLAAVLLSFTFGFLMLAHEGGEDIPALFFVLLVVYFALRYIQTGDSATFLAGCAAGGVALAFKLTSAPVVILITSAYLLRVRNAADWRAAGFRPRLFVAGALLGAVTTILGFPTVLAAASFDPLLERFTGASQRVAASQGLDASVWWWFLRGYLGAFGLPMFVGVIGGVVASVWQLRKQPQNVDGTILLLIGIVAYFTLFFPWQSFRIHHLLPTFPMLALLLAAALIRLHEQNSSVARPIIAVLLITGGVYAVAGDLGYATQPRDNARDWLNLNASNNATLEIYTHQFQEAAIPHRMEVNNYQSWDATNERRSNNERALTEWMRNVTNRCPEYIELNQQDIRDLQEKEPQAAYIRNLLSEEKYPYTIVAEFGTRPPALNPHTGIRSRLPELVRVGLFPLTYQYGDEQDISDTGQYIMILKRTNRCGQ